MCFKEKFGKRNVSLDLRLKKIDETRNNFLEKINKKIWLVGSIKVFRRS